MSEAVLKKQISLNGCEIWLPRQDRRREEGNYVVCGHGDRFLSMWFAKSNLEKARVEADAIAVRQFSSSSRRRSRSGILSQAILVLLLLLGCQTLFVGTKIAHAQRTDHADYSYEPRNYEGVELVNLAFRPRPVDTAKFPYAADPVSLSHLFHESAVQVVKDGLASRPEIAVEVNDKSGKLTDAKTLTVLFHIISPTNIGPIQDTSGAPTSFVIVSVDLFRRSWPWDARTAFGWVAPAAVPIKSDQMAQRREILLVLEQMLRPVILGIAKTR